MLIISYRIQELVPAQPVEEGAPERVCSHQIRAEPQVEDTQQRRCSFLSPYLVKRGGFRGCLANARDSQYQEAQDQPIPIAKGYRP